MPDSAAALDCRPMRTQKKSPLMSPERKPAKPRGIFKEISEDVSGKAMLFSYTSLKLVSFTASARLLWGVLNFQGRSTFLLLFSLVITLMLTAILLQVFYNKILRRKKRTRPREPDKSN